MLSVLNSKVAIKFQSVVSWMLSVAGSQISDARRKMSEDRKQTTEDREQLNNLSQQTQSTHNTYRFALSFMRYAVCL
jgi:hypothetical protein